MAHAESCPQNPQWHPVMPHITDPELAPTGDALRPAQEWGGTAAVAPPPHKGSFFQEHRVAIIVGAIILLIVVFVIFMYFTRRSDKKKDKEAADPPASSKPEEVNLEELNRLRAMRQQARAAKPGGAAPAVATAPAEAPPAAADACFARRFRCTLSRSFRSCSCVLPTSPTNCMRCTSKAPPCTHARTRSGVRRAAGMA